MFMIVQSDFFLKKNKTFTVNKRYKNEIKYKQNVMFMYNIYITKIKSKAY